MLIFYNKTNTKNTRPNHQKNVPIQNLPRLNNPSRTLSWDDPKPPLLRNVNFLSIRMLVVDKPPHPKNLPIHVKS